MVQGELGEHPEECEFLTLAEGFKVVMDEDVVLDEAHLRSIDRFSGFIGDD